MKTTLLPVLLGVALIAAGAVVATQYKPAPKSDTPDVPQRPTAQGVLETVAAPVPPAPREAPFPDSPGAAPTAVACDVKPLEGAFFPFKALRADRGELFALEDGGGGATRVLKVGPSGERTVLADRRDGAEHLLVLGLDVFWVEGAWVLSVSRDGGAVRAIVQFKNAALHGLAGMGNLLYVTLEDSQAHGAVAAVALDGKVTALTGALEAPRAIATDGDTLYVHHGDGELSKLPAQGGAASPVASKVRPPLLADDSGLLYARSGAADARLWRVSADGSSSKELGLLERGAASLRAGTVAFGAPSDALMVQQQGEPARVLCALPLALHAVAVDEGWVWALAGEPQVAFRFARAQAP